ncbi:MAG TPA: glycoside hydrolase family 28 protein [Tepidisphaeraceae bacterium]|jgi:polygalacturonase
MRNPAASLLLILLIAPLSVAAEPRTFSITDHGGRADGKTLNTDAIADTIADAVRAGGGTVVVPRGEWLCGSIELKSNVTLQLDDGAILRMSAEPGDYPVIRTRWEGIECYNYAGLIFARDAVNVAIIGKGVVDGQGPAWWRWAKSAGAAQRRLWELAASGADVKDRIFGSAKDALRPNLIQFIRCRNVQLEGVTVKDSPMWAIHPLECDGVVCRDLYVHGLGPNTDGIDPESCRNVTIEHCTFDCGDDCIAIKSGRDADGRRTNVPTDGVTIRDCTMRRGHAGVAIGSEMSAGVGNVTVTRCTMEGTDRGIRIKTMRGRGGAVQDVRIAELKMTDIVEAAIDIDMEYNRTTTRPTADATTPAFRNVSITDITCTGGKRAAIIRGLLESPIDGLTIRRAKIRADKGITAEYAANVKLIDVEITAKSGPSIEADRAAGWMLDQFEARRPPRFGPLLVFHDPEGLTIKDTTAPDRTHIFLQLTGGKTSNVRLIDCDTSKARERLDLVDDVPADAVE